MGLEFIFSLEPLAAFILLGQARDSMSGLHSKPKIVQFSQYFILWVGCWIRFILVMVGANIQRPDIKVLKTKIKFSQETILQHTFLLMG